MSWTRRTKRAQRTKGPGRSQQGNNKGGGRSGWEMDEWRPTKDPKGEWARFVPGKYADCESCGSPVACNEDGEYICNSVVYGADGEPEKTAEGKWKTCDHGGIIEGKGLPAMMNFAAFVPTGGKNGRGDSVPCNCMDGHLSRPCRLCDEIEGGVLQGKDVKVREKWAYNVILLGKFHKIQKVSKKGNEYEIRVPCVASRVKKCEHCETGWPIVRGKRAYFNPGFGHNGQLKAIDKALGQKCKSCDEGSIQAIGYSCVHCGEVAADLFSVSLTDEELKSFENDPMTCTACGATDYMEEIIECIVEDVDGDIVPGCEDPARTTIFDVDLRLRRAPEDDSKPKSKTVLNQVDVRGPKPIDDAVIDQAEPYDFDFLTQCPPFRQAMRMNVDKSATPTSGRSARRSSTVSYD